MREIGKQITDRNVPREPFHGEGEALIPGAAVRQAFMAPAIVRLGGGENSNFTCFSRCVGCVGGFQIGVSAPFFTLPRGVQKNP
jgi:hypothetical protein